MLKITRSQSSSPPQTVIRLEGKLLEPWVAEVRAACMARDGLTMPRRLDLSAVAFIDDAGIALLDELRRDGLILGPCSAYVAQLLQLEPL